MQRNDEGRPDWAEAKVRLYFARCWWGSGEDGVPLVEGISPFHDWLLMHLDMWIHNWLVQPFFAEEGFPFKLIEQYSTELKGETKYVQTTSRR